MKKIFLMAPVIKTAMVLFALVFLFPLSARSEIRAGSFEVNPFAGYNFFESRQNLENDFVLGGRVGFNFTKNFGIEAVGEYIGTGVDDKTTPWAKEGQFTSPIDDVDITFYHLDLVYHFLPEGNFNPFVAAGYGYAHYSPEINSRDMAIINFGLGAKYWLKKDVALRFDLRDHVVYDETIHNIEATIGIVFAFGGKEKPEPAPVARFETKPEANVGESIVILAAEPNVEEKVKVAVVEPKTIILAFEDVHFDFDKSILTPEAQVILKRSIQRIKDNPDAKIRIAGYTSASGSEEYNQKLSERRAKAVYDYLTNEELVPSEKLATIGYGERSPAMYEPIPKNLYSSEAKTNMRVLFEVVAK
ncbi:MAG: outer membrane beta-barrel domain-containing protein [Desulfobacteraceae bacterium]|nr:MAG: outer membrane beta-barrel domain-containing protein [Desulfobacteraceae bacterium]